MIANLYRTLMNHSEKPTISRRCEVPRSGCYAKEHLTQHQLTILYVHWYITVLEFNRTIVSHTQLQMLPDWGWESPLVYLNYYNFRMNFRMTGIMKKLTGFTVSQSKDNTREASVSGGIHQFRRRLHSPGISRSDRCHKTMKKWTGIHQIRR